MNGVGKFLSCDGNEYFGAFVDDKMEGTGKYTWRNGDVYEGQFKVILLLLLLLLLSVVVVVVVVVVVFVYLLKC